MPQLATTAPPEDLVERVVKVETEVAGIHRELAKINEQLEDMATKEDLSDLRHFFNGRSKEAADRLWIVTRVSLGTVLMLVVVFMKILFGLESAADVMRLWK